MLEGLRPSMLEDPSQEKNNTSCNHFLKSLKHDFSTMEKYMYHALPMRGVCLPPRAPPSVFWY